MIPGETIYSGASPTCDRCKTTPELSIYRSAAGYYIGTYCQCGPYSRESGYYRTAEDAEVALALGNYQR